MPIPWLTALKVIPWGDVIEHAPKVLKTARDLLNQQRQRGGDRVASTSDQATEKVDAVGSTTPPWAECEASWRTTREDLERLQQTQVQMAQTVADLAEQNTRLVVAVEVLRKRSRWLMVVLLVLLCVWVVTAIRVG